MPYSLNKTNGIRLTIVQDGAIDTTTDLTFVGKNYTGYGSPVNENFLKLLENFANGTPPKKPLTGQLWHDTNTKRLKVYDGKKFKSVGIVDYGPQRPAGMNAGDLHFNQNSKKLFAFDGVEWIAIGPADFIPGGDGLTESIILDNNSNGHAAYVFTLNNNTSTIFSSDEFSYIIPSNSPYFNDFKRIYPGINLSGSNTLGISATTATNGTLLWGTAASALGLVSGNTLLTADDIVAQSNFESGLNYPLLVLDDAGITVGLQRVFQMHVTNGNVANLSAINGNRIRLNVNAGLGTYTNVLTVDGSSGYALLPNPDLSVNLGTFGNRFDQIYANSLTAASIVGSNVSLTNLSVNSANIANLISTSANIPNLTSANATVSTLNATTITSTTLTSTTIRGTNIFGNAVYDNGFRVINSSTINNYGVRTISGTNGQVNVNAATGDVTVSLPSTVEVDRLEATVVSGSELYDNGYRVITSATIPSAGVTSLKGTSNQILVNSNVNEVIGDVTLSLPSTISVSTINASAITVGGANVFTTYTNGDTGLTNVGTSNGQLKLGGTLNVGSGGTGATTAADARSNLGAQATLSSGVNIKTINGVSLLGSGDLKPIPAGTAMIFAQTNAPTGWTKVTSAAYNDAALRVVTGSTSTGGTVAFSAAFTSKSVSGTVGDTTLTVDQIPSHKHLNGIADDTDKLFTDPFYSATVIRFDSPQDNGNNSNWTGYTSSEGGGQAHGHSFTGTAIDLNVKYVDVIIATKD